MSDPPSTEIDRAAEVLRRGGLVAFPTETVYGLGADATNAEAVARLFAAKDRPRFDPVIVHLAAPEDLEPLVTAIPPVARTLIERFWPGPLTLVLPKTESVPDIVTAGRPTVAVRMPDHALALSLIAAAGRPIAAPSANRFGRLSPTRAEHVAEQLGDRVELILDDGPCQVGIESTVLDLAGPGPRLLRPGATTLEALNEIIGPVDVHPGTAQDEPLASPGMLPRHYAPRTPLELVDDVESWSRSWPPTATWSPPRPVSSPRCSTSTPRASTASSRSASPTTDWAGRSTIGSNAPRLDDAGMSLDHRLGST